ncbi:hypothetical protein V2144_06330 [Erysipelothrix piscisicarius]
MDRELKSIFGNGYGVIYYISHLLVKKSLDDGYLVRISRLSWFFTCCDHGRNNRS